MSKLDTYKIKAIDAKLAQATHMQHHYLHRKAPCSFAFGLYDTEDVLRGVILYGSPASFTLCKGVCGKDEAKNVVELTRLWIDDNTPKNAESFLIGNTLPLIPKEIVVSFAEPAKGHLGVVYQASNWLYTGLSVKHTNWLIEGQSGKHNRHMGGKLSLAQLKETYGDKFKIFERPRKHRYVFINTKNRKRRKELLNKLSYKILPYPKGENNVK